MLKVKRLVCLLLAGFIISAFPISQASAKEPKKDKSGEEITIPGLNKESKKKGSTGTEVPVSPETTEPTPTGLLPDKVIMNIQRGAKAIRETLNKDNSLKDTVNVTASFVFPVKDDAGTVVGYGLIYVLMWTSPNELVLPVENLSAKQEADRKKLGKKIDGALVKLFKLSTDKLLSNRPEFVNITVQLNIPSGEVYRFVSDTSLLRQLPKKASVEDVLGTMLVQEQIVLLTQEQYSTTLATQEFLDLFLATYPNEFQALLEKFRQINAEKAAQQKQNG